MLNTATTWAQQPAGMLVYGESSTPKYRTLAYGTTYWDSAQNITPLSGKTINFVRVVHRPTRAEKILACITNVGELLVSTWSASGGWGPVQTFMTGEQLLILNLY